MLVADITYVPTWAGFLFLAVVVDAFSRVVAKRGPWRSLDQVELATAEWVDWYNKRRLHGALGDIPPLEFEQLYRRRLEAPDAA